jgi:hypothetical protein
MANVIYFFYKTSYLNEEANSTMSSPSVRVLGPSIEPRVLHPIHMLASNSSTVGQPKVECLSQATEGENGKK